MCTPGNSLDSHVRACTRGEQWKLLQLCAEWNTNAKYAFVCHALLDSLFRVLPLGSYLSAGEELGEAESPEERRTARALLTQLMPSLLSYSERHYQRVSRLNQASYMVDFICNKMTHVPPVMQQLGQVHTGAAGASPNSITTAMAVEEEEQELKVFTSISTKKSKKRKNSVE